MSILFKNIKELVQVRTESISFVSGKKMKELPTIKNAYLLIKNGFIADFGTMKNYPNGNFSEVIDATGKMILPSWCDSHTHIVYAGNREGEFIDRINGLSYKQIANRGGGILNSAKKLQNPENDFAILFIEASGCLPMCGVHNFTASRIIQYSQIIRDRINYKYPNMFVHPKDNTIRDVTHLLWTGNPIDSTSSGRNAVFYGDKAIDRSPCGAGTSARIAQLYAKGKLKKGEKFVHESFIGSKFIGCVEEEITLDGKLAIIPSIQGWAKVFGYNTIIIDDEDDPYAHGFQVI